MLPVEVVGPSRVGSAQDLEDLEDVGAISYEVEEAAEAIPGVGVAWCEPQESAVSPDRVVVPLDHAVGGAELVPGGGVVRLDPGRRLEGGDRGSRAIAFSNAGMASAYSSAP